MEIKRIQTTVFIALAITFVTYAHAFSQGEPQMEKFREKKINYFNEKLDLTEDEKKVFWPIYHDHFNRIMKINEDERSLLSYYKNNADYLSEEEIDETITKHFSLQEQRLKIEREYHDKFVKAIGKKKAMTMYTLERDYRMHVLREFRGGNHGKGGPGRNRGGRSEPN